MLNIKESRETEERFKENTQNKATDEIGQE